MQSLVIGVVGSTAAHRGHGQVQFYDVSISNLHTSRNSSKFQSSNRKWYSFQSI